MEWPGIEIGLLLSYGPKVLWEGPSEEVRHKLRRHDGKQASDTLGRLLQAQENIILHKGPKAGYMLYVRRTNTRKGNAIDWMFMSHPNSYQFSSVTQSSDSLQPHGLQHARLSCPSPTPWVYSSSCQSSWWCHPTISSSVISFSCLQSFPASGSFQMSQLFASGGQSIGFSASASVLPVNIQDWFSFRMDWLDLLAVQGTLKSLLQYHSSKSVNFSVLSFLYSPTLTSIRDYWKNCIFD